MKIFVRLQWIFLFIAAALFGLERREAPLPMRVSIPIPCHYSHFIYLDTLLTAFTTQTVLPDEVVISLSEFQKVDPRALAELEGKQWPFSLVIVKHTKAYPPGRNRNEACARATGDLFICQDADDLPHPQRVEIIKYLFEHYKIEHLLHQWQSSGTVFNQYDAETLAPLCASVRVYDRIPIQDIHNGSVSMVRAVFEKVHWMATKEIDEDVRFNRTAYALSTYKAVVPASLLIYRPELSTFDLDGTKNVGNVTVSTN